MGLSAQSGEDIFGQTKTLCVGRFLVDVPMTATVAYGTTWVPYDIERLVGEADNIGEHLMRLNKELEEARFLAHKDLLKENSVLGKVLPGSVEGQRTFIGLNKGMAAFHHVWSLIPLGRDLYIASGSPSGRGDAYLKVVHEFHDLAKRMSVLAPGEIPGESGFCIDGALVRDSLTPRVEKIQLGVRLNEYPDVHFSIQLVRKDYVVESDAIEPRLNQAEHDAIANGSGEWYSRIKVLRKGSRTLGPWKGFEALAHIPPQRGLHDTHDFNFVALGIPKNPLVPTIDMKLDTGVQDNQAGAARPSISDRDALYIWDRITKSIRLRPVTPSK